MSEAKRWCTHGYDDIDGTTQCPRSYAPRMDGDPGWAPIGWYQDAEGAWFCPLHAELNFEDIEVPAVRPPVTIPVYRLPGEMVIVRMNPDLRELTDGLLGDVEFHVEIPGSVGSPDRELIEQWFAALDHYSANEL